MERAPVAQMNNGQPYVELPTLAADTGSVNEMDRENLRDLAVDVSTVWTTAVVTSVEVQTSIMTSIIVTISTSIVSVLVTPGATQQSTDLLISATNTNQVTQTESQTGSTKAPDMSMPTPLVPLLNSNSSSGSSIFMTNPSASNMIPSSQTNTPSVVDNASNQEGLAKVMAGLIVGIFLTAALLAFGLYIFRKREEKHSEVEAANSVERQQQPLMNEPIVPYSSAYGTDPQHRNE